MYLYAAIKVLRTHGRHINGSCGSLLGDLIAGLAPPGVASVAPAVFEALSAACDEGWMR